MENSESAHRKSRIAVKGMHCAACSSRIERVLGSMDGVEHASVNLAAESLSLSWDESVATYENIKEKVAGLGFELADVELQRGTKKSSVSDFELRRAEQEAALESMKGRLTVMLLFAIPLLYISMGEMIGLPLPDFILPHVNPQLFALTQIILVLPVVWFGRTFYTVGIPALFKGVPNMDSLIAVGTGAAIVYSLWNTVEIFLKVSPHAKAMDLYFESAGVLITLVSLGKYMESRSKFHTSDAIAKLLELKPEKAILLEGENQREIPAEEIETNNLLLVRPGERIPVDAVIEEGSTSIDESMLTGESMPVSKTRDDLVYGGTLNKNGVLKIRCTQTGEDTVLSGIVRMVQEAQGSKAPIASLADRISLYFVPAVMTFAVLTGLVWYYIGGVEFSQALRFFIAVLVIACPCAMGLATPTSLMVGTGRGAQLGILIKNAAALELAEKIEAIVFDKTGTITRGKPELTDITTLNGNYSENELLKLAGSAEQSSEHPLAEAIVETAKARGAELVQPTEVQAISGRGLSAVVDGRTVRIGNKSFLETVDPHLNRGDERAAELSASGKTVLYLAVDNELAALLSVADRLKPESREIIERLRGKGKRIIMLTGDNDQTAQAIAAEAGIDEIIAEVMPHDKAAQIKKLQQQGVKTAMVGDGINDAPALAQAEVGIAMGTGVDIAVESGDIVLMKGNLDTLYTALKLSRAVMRNIRQNLFWAFAFNVIGIPVAAGLLYIFGGPTLNPMIAGGAMALSSVTVVTNALRLRFFSA